MDIPVDPYLYEALTKCGVETDILAKSNFEFYGRAFLSLLPTVLVVLCIRALQYRTKELFSEKIYDLLRMNRKHLILVCCSKSLYHLFWLDLTIINTTV